MLARVRRGLTFANVVSLIALFVALGGGAYAAFRLPKNSVATKQLRNGAVTHRKLAKHAVTAANIAPHSVTGTQLDSSTLPTVPDASSADHATNSDELGGLPASDYLLGGGRLLFNRVEIGDPTGSGGNLLSLPGLGQFEVAACSTGAVAFYAQYHNTTSQTVELWFAQGAGVTAGTGDSFASNYDSVAPGATVVLKNSNLRNWQQSVVTLGTGSGAGSRSATAVVSVSSATSNGTHSTCTFQVQAAVQPGH
jgi:hypothetical protein